MAATASGYRRTPGGWDWPADLSARQRASDTPSHASVKPDDTSKTAKPKHYGPRTCRICLDTVLPTFHDPPEGLPEMLQGQPSVTYDSEGGRLLRPCKCKGSAKYVHEQCLQEWRHADPSYGRRNYWSCPTCGFQYRLGRMSWAHWISSTAMQMALTIVIFMLAIFMLGFIADPIINLYLDPVSTISSMPSAYNDPFQDTIYAEEEDDGWTVHFLKGFASLGLLGFVKVFFTMGPWNWFNMRHIIGSGGSTGNTGRNRLANVSWLVVLLGVCTFLYTVWKIVRAWSRRVLERASEIVMDVPQGDNDDDADD